MGQVAGSAVAWQTVVFNLILNAIEHTPAGGTAHVGLEIQEGNVIFETNNPGEPLDDARREVIFEPFVTEGGTGLGLALVARRLRELGGTVDVESAEGRVCFRVKACA